MYLKGLPVKERLLLQSQAHPSGCVIWIGSCDKDGYGYIKHNGKTNKAHRVSYIIHNGDIPANMWILHTCDNPRCINPEHLYAGTAQQNMDDRKIRGRDTGWTVPPRPGETNSNAKLTQEQVDTIRSRYRWGMGPKLAAEFGIGVIAIRRLMQNKSWVQ